MAATGALAITSFVLSIALSYVAQNAPLWAFLPWLLLAGATVFCGAAGLRRVALSSPGQRGSAAATLIVCLLIALLGAFFVLFTVGYSRSTGG
jgi:hypothetical protein